MKKLTLLFFLISSLTSCTVSNFYQVYKANSVNGVFSKDRIVYDDKNCSISYNLWAEGGDIGFSIYNKTDNDLIIDLAKTFFVINDVAYEYYQNRTFSKSSTSGTMVTSFAYYRYWYWNWQPSKVSGTNSTTFSTSFNERSELTIPSKTSIPVSEFHISNSRYVNCDLTKYPSRNKIKTLTFNKSNSPFVFYNLVTYVVKTDISRMENRFYVSEVTNLPESEMFTKKYANDCGVKYDYPEKIFRDVKPDKFFVHYTRER